MTRSSQKDLYFRFKKNIADNSLIKEGSEIILACSGGPDSVCLFDLLERLSKEINFSFIVAHYNHKIRGTEANADEKFVQKLARKNHREFVLNQSLSEKKISSEEEARNKRYQFLQKLSQGRGGAKIFVAHNKNDRAETLLLNLIRGAGIRGLSSMQLINGKLIRPLLFAEKKEILAYLSERKIEYRLDKSNKFLVYTRNIMRHIVIPELEKINPSVISALSRTSDLATDANEFIRSQAQLSLRKVMVKNKNQKILLRKNFIALSPAIQSEVIRIIAEENGCSRDLTMQQVEDVLIMTNKNSGKKKKIIAGKLKFELIRGKLILSTNKF